MVRKYRVDGCIDHGASLPPIVRLGSSSRPGRHGPEDPSIRRTWWLLSGAFLLLGSFALVRVISTRDPIDLVPVIVVAVAAIAAIGHRNAVAGLEARGRGEAESFARILRGLSRSVSSDAVVAAIMDDLVDATGADHVVVVRRRQDGTALEATLVTRRAGVPSTTTILPVADLDDPITSSPAQAVAVGPGPESGNGHRRADDRDGEADAGAADRELVAVRGSRASDEAAGVAARTFSGAEDPSAEVASPDGRPFVRRAAPPGRDAIPGPFVEPTWLGRAPVATGSTARRSSAAPAEATASAGAGLLARAALSEAAALLQDLGLPAITTRRSSVRAVETLGTGLDTAVAERITERVRSVFGLPQTLTAPLRTDQGLIGVIVLSRRDREPWSDAERRILRGGASEAANALTRADTHRETEALAATDPLTGLPNRRYFDEFCSLLARRRRAGDAVAVLMIDIDKFKVLNDTYGHPVGDEVLKAVAGAIVSTVRDHDVPARVGGEEFAVLLRNPGPDVALEVGERVREAVRALDLSEFRVPGVSVSVGVAHALGPEEEMPEIVGRADQALLLAKRAGRDRVVAA
jgi:diguanylate cyclase (GGDEF)-like protein